jgi:preprotein translocase subunit SecB
MEHQTESENADATRLILHRVYVKNSSFESFGLNLNTIQNPVQPTLEMQVFANVYAQENNLHQAVLGLTIQAKHQADVIWKIQLEQAGFYTLEGFSEEQQKTILNGFCMNQLYAHTGPVVTQMVVQAGFAPIYLQPMDFHQLYVQQQQKEKAIASTNTPLNGSAPRDLGASFKALDEHLQSTRALN